MAARAAGRVAVLIVTWNRKSFVTKVLEAVSRQTYPVGLLDVVVIDNAGTDGTLEEIRARFRPERVVPNDTVEAHEPRFGAPLEDAGASLGGNTLGFHSLTVVRNAANTGGCGGFNTGFAYVEHAALGGESGPRGSGSGPWMPRPDFLWLVDDDIDLPPDALEHLTGTMEAEPGAGLVGSRTVDIAHRQNTIETTIYFNRERGSMQDDAPPGHRCEAAHRAFIARTGGPRGTAEYRGVMDVDVVSACSMLARYDAVVGGARAGGRAPVGYWDHRYFIYCDDADWCLRFAKHGWKVLLNLDAVVFHTPWNLKLTPARIYYAHRNRAWMCQKVMPTWRLRLVTLRMLRSILRDARGAAVHRRQFHAEIIRRTAEDIVAGRAGKTGSDGPPAVPVAEAFEGSGLLSGGKRVAVVCRLPGAPEWARALREHVRAGLKPGQVEPEWDLVFRNDVPDAPADAIIYGGRLRSRLKKQLLLRRRRPDAVVVFDQTNDLPLLMDGWRGGVNIHIDQKKPTMAQVEADGWRERVRFFARWVPTALRCYAYAATVRPYRSETKYG